MTTHPLEMLTGDEILASREILKAAGKIGDDALFASIVLHEPEKAALASWKPGDPVERRLRATIVPGPENMVIEAVVNLATKTVESWTEVTDVRPTLLMGEAMNAVFTTVQHPDYIAALERRGITEEEREHIQIDPWPAGAFGYEAEEGRRIARCISFLREHNADNGYARPIEGLIVHFDMGRNEVIEVIDHGATPLAPNRASYLPEDQPAMRTDLKPIEITQTEGPSFSVEGNLIT